MKPLDPRLLRQAAAARTYVLAAAVLSALATVCIIAQAFAIGHSLGPIALGTTDLAGIATPLVIFAVVIAARAALTWARERLGAKLAVAVVNQLRTRLLDHTTRLPFRWRAAHGDEVTTLATRGLDDLVPYITGYLPQLLMTAILTPVGLGVMLWLDLTSGIIVAITLPLIPVFMWLVGVTTRDYSAKRLDALAAQGAQLLDLLAGLTTLRALGREWGPGTRVRRLGEAYRRTTMQTLRVAFLSGAVLELLASLSVALVAVEIGMRLVYGRIDLVTGLTVLVLAPEIYQPLRQVGMQFHASTNGITAVARTFDVLDVPLPAAGSAPVRPWRELRLRGISVAAAERGYLAPHQLSGRIERGKVTALAGPSGSGKTTTAMALLLLQPTDSGVLQVVHDVGAAAASTAAEPQAVDAVPNAAAEPQAAAEPESTDLADLDPQAWWDQAAWVPQRILTAGGTVREHVDPSGTLDAAALTSAATQTGLDQAIAALPQGWDTPLARAAGGLTSGLSVGQTHRLELTRALVRQAALVVLDEPTAHLAPQDEALIIAAMRALAAAGAAVVVVAHRPATLAAADAVIQVEAAPLPASSAATQTGVDSEFAAQPASAGAQSAAESAPAGDPEQVAR